MKKKILTLTLALAMALSLAACGEKDDPKPSGSTGTSQQEPEQTPSVSDNSDETDTSSSKGSGWPENEMTSLIPEPTTGTAKEYTYDMRICTISMEWTYADAKAYAQTVKDIGFDQSVSEQDAEAVENYMFSAKNSDGVTVAVTYSGALTYIKIF